MEIDINKKSFLKGGGWRHNFCGWALLYILMYWGASEYAHTTKLWPSSMMSTLDDLGHMGWQWIGEYLIYMIVITILACVIEMIEYEFWKAAFSVADVIYTSSIGGTLGYVTYKLVPQNGLIFWVAVLLIPVLIVDWYRSEFKTQR